MKKKKVDAIAQAAKEHHCSRQKVVDSMLTTWTEMRCSPDLDVRKFIRALEPGGRPPAPEKILLYLKTLFEVSDMLPFIHAGYSEQDYNRLRKTELASSLRARYGEGELTQMAMDEVIRLYRKGNL